MVDDDFDSRRVSASGAAMSGDARLVSLSDGREYPLAERTMVLGRDPGADVVVPDDAVSRRHAELRPAMGGWLLVDTSATGVQVNGEAVEGARKLVRDDVIRLGRHEYRFDGPNVTPAGVRMGPPPGAEQQLSDTLHGVPVEQLGVGLDRPVTTAAAPAGPPIASFLVRGGALKGQRLDVFAPVANLGRAEYNDVVLPDPSVSTVHAKLQRRDQVWILQDLESTNGTFVDGERLIGEMPLGPGSTIQLGEVRLLFEPRDEPAGAPAAEPMPPPVRRAAPRPPAASLPPRKSRVGIWVLILVLAALALVALTLLT